MTTNNMKKIITLLAIAIVGLASCKKNEMEINGMHQGEYDLYSEFQKNLYNDVPYPPFGAEKDLYGEYGIKWTFDGVNLTLVAFEDIWSVSCDADWCHYEYTTEEYFETSTSIVCRLELSVTIDENTTGETRNANINITCYGYHCQLTITQLATPEVIVSTPGTLTQELANKDLLYATSLKISGELNDKDLETIKGLQEIETLDLTGAIIDDLPDEMFCMNETIKQVKLPETIKVIHPRTFAFSSLEYIYFPASIETIEDGEMYTKEYSWSHYGAFANTNLATIEFAPNSKLKYIGECAFAGTGRYEYQEYSTYQDQYTFEVTLPKSVETIADYAFCFNSRGETVGVDYESRQPDVDVYFEAGSKLKSFGTTFLLYSISIDATNSTMVERVGWLDADHVSVAIGTQIPPASGGVDSGESSYLSVPKGCVGAYYEADGWKEFDRIGEIE